MAKRSSLEQELRHRTRRALLWTAQSRKRVRTCLLVSVPSCHSHVRWSKIARSSFWTRPPRLLTTRRIVKFRKRSLMGFAIAPFYALPVRSSLFVRSLPRGDFASLDRLRTIISYDRICVLDNGKIAEFDVSEVLHAQDGIFRGMCEHSSITLEDIRRARKEREAGDKIAL